MALKLKSIVTWDLGFRVQGSGLAVYGLGLEFRV